MNLKAIAYSILILAVGAQDGEGVCKPVETVVEFNIEQYVAAPWYIHQQMETTYSPPDRNFCTRAQYGILEEKTFLGYTVSVNNQAQDAAGNDFGGPLCALQNDKNSSKLAVAPCFLPPKLFAGPYWIVAYDEAQGYALVSGGQPSIKGNDGGCRTGTGVNNSGLWIFSRHQERDEDLIDKVQAIAVAKGFDISVLKDVVQDGCQYEKCADREEKFRVWYGSEKSCDWIHGFWKTLRCIAYGDKCPETCGKCPA